MAPKGKKKRNYTDSEIETIVSEVEARKGILLKSVSTGLSGTAKKDAWDAITKAVNAVSRETRSVNEVKKKWFDLKVDAKKRITDQKRKKETGGGQGPPDLSAHDERMAAIIGGTALSGILSGVEGDSDMPSLRLSQSESDGKLNFKSLIITIVNTSDLFICNKHLNC